MIKNKGMTLFIAVVIMSILLFISFAVVNITLKATLFASSGRDSQYAFYAADSGIECAIYWDSKYDKFATSTPSGSIITCAGNSLTDGSTQIIGTSTTALTKIGGGGNANPSSIFSFRMDQDLYPANSTPYCAIVSVTKVYEDRSEPLDGYKETLVTYIKSRGYNTCELGNSRRIERGVEVNY